MLRALIDSALCLAICCLQDLERKPPSLLRPGKPIRRGALPSDLLPSVRAGSWSTLPPGSFGSSRPRLVAITEAGPLPALWELAVSKPLSRQGAITIGVGDLISARTTTTHVSTSLSQPIRYLNRTPNGRGLLAVGTHGEHTVWTTAAGHAAGSKSLLSGRAQWQEARPAEKAGCTSLFAGGRGFASSNELGVQLRHIDHDGTVTDGIELPDFHSEDRVISILALSDVDDGISSSERRSQQTCVVAACDDGTVYTWSVEGAGLRTIEDRFVPSCKLISRIRLPWKEAKAELVSAANPAYILPVDPMGWHASTVDWDKGKPLQDMLLLITTAGDLTFWRPSARTGSHRAMGSEWNMTGRVHSGRTSIINARCSARRKTALGESA